MTDREQLCTTVVLKRLKSHEPLLGGWMIKDYIGAGASACVFKVEKRFLGQQQVSALKAITITRRIDRRHKTLDSLKAAVEQEAAEATHLYELAGHTNIIGWHDSGIITSTLGNDRIVVDILLRMDYFPNSLATILLRQGILSWERTVGILVDCLKGLEYAHSHHILHRDIKPENIFINDKGRAMIGDFSVARKISRSTMARTYIGTPLYMAPEVIGNPLGDAYDWKADIYSLGLVAFEMLTGKLPFEEKCKGDENCIVERRLNNNSIDLKVKGPPHIREAVLKALAWDPTKRFSSAREFRKALEKASIAPVSGGRKGSVDTISPGPEISSKTASQHKDTKKALTIEQTAGKKKAELWVYLVITLLVLVGSAYALWQFFQSPTGKYRLTVSPEPSHASVRIINPEMEYIPGIQVEPGLYKIEVALNGYVTQERQVRVVGRDIDMRVKLNPMEIMNRLDMKFVYITHGSFMMGSRVSELGRGMDEKQHKIILADGFYIQTTEVTNEQFVIFLNNVGKRGPKGRPWFETKEEDSESHIIQRMGKYYVEKGYETHPVIEVSWYGAIAFAQWLSQKEGMNYRLPSEPEWEYACRAGSTTAYFWGDEQDAACAYANVADRTVKKRFPKWPIQDCMDGYLFTAPVGSFSPNAFGLYDMLGNTWEWCQDWYEKGKQRVLRGASWGDNAGRARCANRGGNAPASRSDSVGFRLAASLPK